MNLEPLLIAHGISLFHRRDNKHIPEWEASLYHQEEGKDKPTRYAAFSTTPIKAVVRLLTHAEKQI